MSLSKKALLFKFKHFMEDLCEHGKNTATLGICLIIVSSVALLYLILAQSNLKTPSHPPRDLGLFSAIVILLYGLFSLYFSRKGFKVLERARRRISPIVFTSGCHLSECFEANFKAIGRKLNQWQSWGQRAVFFSVTTFVGLVSLQPSLTLSSDTINWVSSWSVAGVVFAIGCCLYYFGSRETHASLTIIRAIEFNYEHDFCEECPLRNMPLLTKRIQQN